MRTISIKDEFEPADLPVRRNCQAAVLLDGVDYFATRGVEYIADYDSMVSLDGRSMRRRRSLIRQFQLSNEGWSFDELKSGNLDEAFEVERLWQREEGDGEAAFVRRCFRSFAELDLTGGILRSGEAALGYSLAAPCGDYGALVLVLRAKPVPAGVTAMLYRHTALLLRSRLPRLRSINLGCGGGVLESRNRMAYHPIVIEHQ